MRKVLLSSFALILLLTSIAGFASCSKVEFKVDFVVDGEVYASVNTNGEETIKIPQTPTKEGYIFDGWYWDKDTWQKPFTANSLLDFRTYRRQRKSNEILPRTPLRRRL